VQRRLVVRVQVYGSRGDDQARGIQHLGASLLCRRPILAILPFLMPISAW